MNAYLNGMPTNKQVIEELPENPRKSRTIDRKKKESARAGMRQMVKRLLKRHRYPPNEIPNAIVTVIRQRGLWADTA